MRGALFVDKGDFQNAFNDFNHCLLLRPNDPVALARRGMALYQERQPRAGPGGSEPGHQTEPCRSPLLRLARRRLRATNHFDDALQDFDHAIQLSPHEAAFYSSRDLFTTRNGITAKRSLILPKRRRLIRQRGSIQQSGLASSHMPEDSFRNGKEAITLATRACELTGFKRQNILDTLAAGYAEIGEFEQAIKYEKQSFALVTSTNKTFAGMQERLALYEQHKPYRQKPSE